LHRYGRHLDHEKEACRYDGISGKHQRERADDHPKCYTKIFIEFVLEGKRLSPKDVERAIELSATKYCSAIASMSAPVETSCRIVEKEG